ncbi:MAG: hypothetical protein EF813_12455 [Methanosarcinales archaeon]|nr:MAG: hypothetical protein EF813_12455 [Methanosarcinales archaeon]
MRLFGNDENDGKGAVRMNKTMKDIKPILDEAKERLQKIYGEQLEGIIIYGFGTKFTYAPAPVWHHIAQDLGIPHSLDIVPHELRAAFQSSSASRVSFSSGCAKPAFHH